MRRRFRWELSLFCTAILLTIGYCCAYGWYRMRAEQENIAGVQDVAHIGKALAEFFVKNARWPQTLMEFDLLKADGMEIAKLKDYLSGRPYIYLGGKDSHWYVNVGGKRYRVLVLSPKPFRTRLWPFGHMETIVLADDLQTSVVTPGDIRDGSGNVFDSKYQRPK